MEILKNTQSNSNAKTNSDIHNQIHNQVQTNTEAHLQTKSSGSSEINLKYFSSRDLDLRMKKLVATERKILHHILACISEIDLRKLYLDQGYPSLFEYLVKSIGYSPASAQRRIDAARLIRQVPEVAQKIEMGEINLSQVSSLQKTIREVEKTTSNKVSLETKKEILDKISNANTQKTEVIIAQELNMEAPSVTQVKVQNHRDESQSLTLHFSKEEIEILNQARDLVSNATKSSSLKEAILHLAKREVERRAYYKKRAKISTKKEVAVSAKNGVKVTFNSEAEVTPSQYRKMLLRPGACCEYVHPETKQKCGATRFLNVDHIQPKWAGGDDSLENLRVYCSAHNKYRYEKQSGLKFINNVVYSA